MSRRLNVECCWLRDSWLSHSAHPNEALASPEPSQSVSQLACLETIKHAPMATQCHGHRRAQNSKTQFRSAVTQVPGSQQPAQGHPQDDPPRPVHRRQDTASKRRRKQKPAQMATQCHERNRVQKLKTEFKRKALKAAPGHLRRIATSPDLGSRVEQWAESCWDCLRFRQQTTTAHAGFFASRYRLPFHHVLPGVEGRITPAGVGGSAFVAT